MWHTVPKKQRCVWDRSLWPQVCSTIRTLVWISWILVSQISLFFFWNSSLIFLHTPLLSATCMCLLLLSSSSLCSGQYSLLAVPLHVNGYLYIVPMKCWDDWGWTVILNLNSPLVHWTIHNSINRQSKYLHYYQFSDCCHVKGPSHKFALILYT